MMCLETSSGWQEEGFHGEERYGKKTKEKAWN